VRSTRWREFVRLKLQGHGVLGYVGSLCTVLSWRLIPAVLLTLLAGFTEGISILLLIPLLQIVGVDVGHGPVGRLGELASGLLTTLHLRPSLLTVLVVFVVLVSAKAWLARFVTLVNYRLKQAFAAYLRLRLYRAITSANWLFLTRSRSTDFNHALTRELDRAGGLTETLLSLVTSSVMLSVYLGLALVLAPAITSLVLACGLLVSLALRRRLRLSHNRGEDLRKAYGEMYAVVGEHLAGMKTAKGLGVERRHAQAFASVVREAERAQLGVLENQLNVGLGSQIGSVATLALVVYIALEVFAISGAAVLLLLFAFARLIPRLSGLQGSYQNVLNTLPAFEYVMGMISRCEAAAEPESDRTDRLTLTRAIRLDGVSFAYEPRKAVLRGLDLTIDAGKTTAIVGSSGAGKSSLADLAAGLIAPDSGRILIDHAAMTPQNRAGWRGQIGYVAQESFLFHDSIRANLLVARPEATDSELNQALSEAAAADFVHRLPDGLETVVGDRGVRLSGGERQRLALARALLRRPMLLVLDEATSALDSENEQRIQQAVDGLRGTMTILVIAHRLSTIRNADVIHVLEEGRIVESGDWSTLTARAGGRFRALCETQGILEPEGQRADQFDRSAPAAHPVFAGF
jgi:ATP-binding cassette, subfamily C, bacterial